MIKAINGLNILKNSVFKNNAVQQCPCGDKKAAPIKPFAPSILKDTFELQCCGNKK